MNNPTTLLGRTGRAAATFRRATTWEIRWPFTWFAMALAIFTSWQVLPPVMAIFAGWIGITVLTLLFHDAARGRTKPMSWRQRAAVPVFLIVTLLLHVQIDECPHGQYLQFWDMETWLSGEGCRNNHPYRPPLMKMIGRN